jgi:hypothetical protein
MPRKFPSPRFIAIVLSILVGVIALAIAGCSKKLTQPVVSGSSDAATAGSAQRVAELGRAIGVQNAHTRELMTLPDVIGTGTGLNAAGHAAILVLSKQSMGARLPREIGGIPVEERVVGVVEAYGKPGGGGTIQCGTSTGNDRECAAGTIGCVVLKGGNKFFLSNNHVFARENAASIGERIDAPGRYDAHPKCAQTPILGNLSDFQAISFSGNNTIDCAIAAPASGVSFSVAEASGYTPTSTVAAAFVGQAVKKTGRTSGLTTGTVQAINVTIQVQYSSGIATFVNQIMTPGSFIRSGDSGSLMVEQATNNPVGLCFAGGSGGSFANPIGPVLQKFGATVATQ